MIGRVEFLRSCKLLSHNDNISALVSFHFKEKFQIALGLKHIIIYFKPIVQSKTAGRVRPGLFLLDYMGNPYGSSKNK